ncbi:hypothetical protein D3C81_1741180 [compost metagenome]
MIIDHHRTADVGGGLAIEWGAGGAGAFVGTFRWRRQFIEGNQCFIGRGQQLAVGIQLDDAVDFVIVADQAFHPVQQALADQIAGYNLRTHQAQAFFIAL